jgi:hypothetical protein
MRSAECAAIKRLSHSHCKFIPDIFEQSVSLLRTRSHDLLCLAFAGCSSRALTLLASMTSPALRSTAWVAWVSCSGAALCKMWHSMRQPNVTCLQTHT